MAAAALQTFGVDADLLNAKMPQVSLEGTNDVLTAARVTEIIESAAADVCGVVLAVGLPLSDIAGDTASVAYRLCQSMIVDLCRVNVLRAVQGHGRNLDALDRLEQAAYRRLDRVRKQPGLLGYDADDSYAPGGYTTTSLHDDRDATDPVVNRRWQTYEDEPERW